MELNNWSLVKSGILGSGVLGSGPLIEEVQSLEQGFDILWSTPVFLSLAFLCDDEM